MTEEELNQIEAVVRERAAAGDIDPEPSLSLIPLSALPKPGGGATSKHHDWQISDSSLYDFKCRNCGTTDRSKDADLPCTKPGGE